MAAAKAGLPPGSRSHWKGPSGHLYPIIDASGDVLIPSIPESCVIDAQRFDPCNCAIARAWMEMTGAQDCMIGRTVAYLVTLKGGVWVALRFRVPAETQRAIEHYDRTGEFPPDGVWMRAIPPSDRLDSRRADEKRLRERWAEAGRKRKREPHHTRSSTFRNASDIARTIVMRKDSDIA